ncbi:hypothetical protein [Halodesulfovibrio sp. MK-HDV]|jgi:hypothetical protein|uniref:tetratricopeptide repeat protein n=1 Tax=Halodesulfovibrio sp. MK-HDV TaxID=2599925 RepID=UPI00136BED5E|nr:hypothetical protein [Halodesulfovibrio sp. MK-HDV]KAF1073762.1 hypothetical protein MKHDV_03383 [Halodesulfovibrio sp. MK-HDV]
MKLCSLGGLLLIIGIGMHVAPVHASVDDSMKRSAIYEAKYMQSPSGVYEYKDDFFVIVELPRLHDESRKVLKKQSRQCLVKELVKWGNANSPQFSAATGITSSVLRQDLSDFMAQGTSFFGLDGLSVAVLVDKPVKKTYRLVIAGKRAALNKQLEAYQEATVDYAALMEAYIRSLVAEGANSRLSKLFAELGEEFLAARFIVADLSDSYPLANYSLRTNSLAQRRLDVVISKKSIVDADYALLAVSPANNAIMHTLHDSFPKGDIEPFSIAMLAHAAFPKDWSLETITAYSSNSLTSFLLNHPSSLQLAPEHIVSMVLDSGGCFFMDPSVTAIDTISFQSARKMFAKREPVGAIQTKLMKAISQSPANASCWDYLGAVFKAKKNWRDSAAVYRQLLMLQPTNGEAMASYAESVWHLGFTDHAKWLCITARAMATPKNRAVIKKITQRITDV